MRVGCPQRLNLDEHGATLVKHRSLVSNFYDDTLLVEAYYPEAAAVLRQATGAQRVVVFDHNVRRGLSVPLRPGRYAQGRPVLHAHTDYTEQSGGPVFMTNLARKRPRFVGVASYRSTCGARSPAPCEMHRLQSATPAALPLSNSRRSISCTRSVGEKIHYLTHAAGQRWYYAPDMQPDEAWLIKNFDSALTGTDHQAARSAFDDPTPHRLLPVRESIEIRAFAFFDASTGPALSGPSATAAAGQERGWSRARWRLPPDPARPTLVPTPPGFRQTPAVPNCAAGKLVTRGFRSRNLPSRRADPSSSDTHP